jgi:DeoR family transcriptional regulator, ulaG and ulaABCDEF operon transcriptional repressor
MIGEQRHALILRMLSKNVYVSVHEVAGFVNASEATIRRDFVQLEMEGKIRRVRGGAELVSIDNSLAGFGELPLEDRKGILSEKKRMIAREAARLCEDHETIMIDGGSTTYNMVEFLTGMKMQVLTNSFAIAEYLLQHSENQVILPGGVVYPHSQLILNPFEDNLLRNYYAKIVFMGAGAINQKGALNNETLLIQTERTMIDHSNKLVLLCDSSKFTKQGSLLLCGWGEIDTIITDSDIDKENREMVLSRSVNLIEV